jgi:hypothetical protein
MMSTRGVVLIVELISSSVSAAATFMDMAGVLSAQMHSAFT